MIQMKCIANHLLNYNLTERIKDINFLLDLTPLTRVDERGIRGAVRTSPSYIHHTTGCHNDSSIVSQSWLRFQCSTSNICNTTRETWGSRWARKSTGTSISFLTFQTYFTEKIENSRGKVPWSFRNINN